MLLNFLLKDILGRKVGLKNNDLLQVTLLVVPIMVPLSLEYTLLLRTPLICIHIMNCGGILGLSQTEWKEHS